MLGEKLKQIRTGKGLSQKALADLLGTSSGYISELEQGKKMPGSDFLISLKRELGVSLDWLLMGEGGTEALIVVGKRIENYRRSLRYKVGEFANIVGISRGVLSDIENQKVIPSEEVLEAIIRNSGINPQWLSTGEGPMSKDDYRTGDGRPFFAYKEQDNGEIDHDLMWNVVNEIQNILLWQGKDPQKFSHNKRVIIQNLLYADTKQKNRQIDKKYAELLLSLTNCEVCEEKKSKERWQKKWGIKVGPGLDLEEVLITVKAPPGLKCPMEGMYREYITGSVPVSVHCTAYYRKLVDEGSLILVMVKTAKGRTSQTTT